MAKTKQGDLFSCTECGLIVVVEQGCECGATELICCEQPMAKGKLAAAKARKKAPALIASKKVETKKPAKAPLKTKAKVTAKPKAPAPKVKKAVTKTQAKAKKV